MVSEPATKMDGGELTACDDDRSRSYLHGSFVPHVRTVGALDLGFRSNVRRVPEELRPYRYNEDPHPATTPTFLASIPETGGFIAADRARWRPRRIDHPTRVEFPESTGELRPCCWSAHPSPLGDYPTSPLHRAISDQIQGEFELTPNFSYFDGESCDEDYLEWEQEVDDFFYYVCVPREKQVRCVVRKLKGRAKTWWTLMLQARHLEGRSEVKSWRKMKSMLRSQFITSDYKVLSDVAKPSGVDEDAKGMDIDVQLSPGERDAEVKSYSRMFLEVDKPAAVSIEVFEPIATSSQVMDSGDGFDGDQKRRTYVNVESMPIDTELSHGKSVAKVEFHGEKFFEVDRDDERSTELPALSTEGWFLSCEAKSEPVNFFDGCGDDQRLETEVYAESMVRTDEDFVDLSIASGAHEDARKGRQVYLGDYNMAEKAANLVTGSEIRWEDLVLAKKIREGMLDIVYHEIWIGSDVAIKVYTRMDYPENILLHYKKEVAIMKKLRHSNILLFLGAVYSPEHLAIVSDVDVDCPRTQGWQITFPPKPLFIVVARTQGWQIIFPPKPGWLNVYSLFFLRC